MIPSSSHRQYARGTGMPARPSAEMTRYSRSIACAEGRSFAAGAGFARIT